MFDNVIKLKPLILLFFSWKQMTMPLKSLLVRAWNAYDSRAPKVELRADRLERISEHFKAGSLLLSQSGDELDKKVILSGFPTRTERDRMAGVIDLCSTGLAFSDRRLYYAYLSTIVETNAGQAIHLDLGRIGYINIVLSPDVWQYIQTGVH